MTKLVSIWVGSFFATAGIVAWLFLLINYEWAGAVSAFVVVWLLIAGLVAMWVED